jgi:hypothetical protein
MKEKDPQKIREFLESEKVNKKLVADASPAPWIYDIPRLKAILEENPDNVKLK